MTSPTAVDLVQLVLVSVSVPAYLWFIATIIRFRKKKPFDSSFFSLCLALFVADMECLAVNWVCVKFASFEWFGIGEMVRKYTSQMAKLLAFLSLYGSLQQFTGVALMALNRCTALAFFNKHKTIWTSKFTRRAIVCQFLGPLLLMAPLLLSSKESFGYTIDQNGNIGSMVFLNSKIQLFCGMVVASSLWISNIFSMIMYCICFWRIKSINTTVQPERRRARSSSIASNHRERRLSLVGVVLSTLMTIYGVLLVKNATASGESWQMVMVLWSIINDTFSWSNPWLCLLLSPTIRKHMIALITCKAGTVNVNGTKNAKSQKENREGQA